MSRGLVNSRTVFEVHKALGALQDATKAFVASYLSSKCITCLHYHSNLNLTIITDISGVHRHTIVSTHPSLEIF